MNFENSSVSFLLVNNKTLCALENVWRGRDAFVLGNTIQQLMVATQSSGIKAGRLRFSSGLMAL
jgi:hypothetical protein